MHKSTMTLVAVALLATACRSAYQQPDIEDSPNLPRARDGVADNTRNARARGDSIRASIAQQSSEHHTRAMATCSGDVCAAIARMEMALGMNRAGVFAVTSSGPDGWAIRGSESAGTMIPNERNVRDKNAEIAMVTFRDGRVVSYTYAEPSGLRTVSNPADATPDARRRAIAQNLLNQGDEAIAAGRHAEGLMRYDEADVIDPNNPGTTLRIARILDKQNRQVEALMRYQKFLHEMEIERINAVGKANAELTGAIVAAQARVVHLVETTNRKP